MGCDNTLRDNEDDLKRKMRVGSDIMKYVVIINMRDQHGRGNYYSDLVYKYYIQILG